MRIVADTNVIVSALVFGGVPRRVLELGDSGVCELFYSEAIQVEVRRVLVEKFVWSDAKVDEVLPGLWRMGELVIPRFKVNVVSDDPDDNRILECALSASAIFIVSGDRHLLRLGPSFRRGNFWRPVSITGLIEAKGLGFSAERRRSRLHSQNGNGRMFFSCGVRFSSL